MRLRFENTMEDMVAFQKYHWSHSPSLRRMIALLRWGGAVAMVATGVISGMKKGSAFDMFYALAQGLLFAFIFPRLIQWSMKLQTSWMYREGNSKMHLGEQELEIVADGIVERNPYSEIKTSWAALGKVASTSEHTFIYISAVVAHVIPHQRIKEGDYQTFMEELGRRYRPDQTLQSVNRG